MLKLTDLAHNLISNKVKSAKLIIDTTLGNGHDLLFILKNCNKDAQVYGFDIQAKAISATQEKLTSQNFSVTPTLIKACHSQIKTYINSSIDLVIFNLGYLPGGDKTITTKTETSLNCLKNCLDLLNEGGIVSLMLYPGHPTGEIETEAILQYLKTIKQKYRVFVTQAVSPSSKSAKKPPIHCLISR